MDIRELKNYIYEEKYVEQLLNAIGCHHIKYHTTGAYWTCANATGDNNNAIVLYNNDPLICINYTRQMVHDKRVTDIIDLISYTKNLSLIDSLKYICNVIGISYYYDFNDGVPECFKILDMIENMNNNFQDKEDLPISPISDNILDYYYPYVNDIFLEDNIDYNTQKEFEVGFDPESNRYTIPIRSEIGDLIGVKGRFFYKDVPAGESKYVYLEPCPKSKILYGLYKTLSFIKTKRVVYICESEKAVMQCWSMGYKNAVSTGGKNISDTQVNILVRLGAQIIFAFDKDVSKFEIEEIANKFPDGVSIYYIYDENNILNEKESPSDNSNKWEYLVKNCIYKVK